MQICTNCGAEILDIDAIPINIGRKTEILCLKCYKTGGREADVRSMEAKRAYKKKKDAHERK